MRLEKVYLIMDKNYFNNLRVGGQFFLPRRLYSARIADGH